jgi:tetratricopeptide (TPR) repeat protein
MRRLVLALCMLLAAQCNSKRGGSGGANRGDYALASGETMRTRLERTYRLAVDRRVAIALHDLARLAGRGDVTIAIKWRDGRFHVTAGADELGTLAARPTFADELALADAWAARLGLTAAAAPAAAAAKSPSAATKSFAGKSATGGAVLPVDVALGLAREAGSRYAAADPAAVRDGAHALASLAFALPDRMGTGDAVFGRALAVLALARARGVADVADEVLLAWAFGASAHARDAARALPAGHPVARFATDAPLDALADDDTGRALRLRRLLDAGDRIGARRLLDAQPRRAAELATVSARLEIGAFDDLFAVASDAPSLLALHAERDAGQRDALERLRAISERGLRAVLGPPPGSADEALPIALRQLDEVLPRLPADAALGPFLAGDAPGRDVLRATYRVLAYDAIYAAVRYAAVARADAALADALAHALGAARSFANAAPWAQLLADVTSGRRPLATTATALNALPFAGAAVADVVDAAAAHADWGAPDGAALVRAVIGRLDGRPAHRDVVRYAAYQLLTDMALVEAEGRAALAEDPARHAELRVFVARLDGELGSLRPWLRDPRVAPATKAYLLRALAEEKVLAPRDVVAEIAQLPPDERRRFAAVDRFARLLEDQHEYEAARALYEAFLRDGDPAGLDRVRATTGVARELYHQRRFAEAWTAVSPVVGSMQRGAMERGALVLQALGRAREAEDLARRQVEQYPNNADAAGAGAEILWRQARHADAAELLASGRAGTMELRFDIAPHFVAAVDDGLDARAAFAALSARRVDPLLMEQLALAVGHTLKHDALAIALLELVPAPGLYRLQTLSEAAAIVKRSESAAAASAWLGQRVTGAMRVPLSQFVFAERLDDALWDVVPRDVPGERDSSDNVWLFRAAAMLRAPTADAHANDVRAYFAGTGGARYFVLGRALLGLATEADALALAHDPKSACEVAYWLGYKADAEHRVADAITWYRVAVETEQRQVWEYRQAYNRLAAWRGANKSLRRLASEP